MRMFDSACPTSILLPSKGIPIFPWVISLAFVSLLVQVWYPFCLLHSHPCPGPPGCRRIFPDMPSYAIPSSPWPQWVGSVMGHGLIIQDNERSWVFCWTHWKIETLFCEIT